MLMLRGRRGADTPNVLKGALAGAVGGLVGTYVMTKAQQQMMKVMDGGGGGESATAKAARRVAEPIKRRPLSASEKRTGSELAHWGMGVVSGAIYGATAEHMPGVTAGAGTFFGSGLMGTADEVAVPALGLSEPPQERPASTHAYSLAAHIVYGMTTEAVRRTMRRMMN